MAYLHRNISDSVERAARYFPVVVITGPRQSGKSTLCRHLFGAYTYYNLEDLALREHVEADPKAFLEACGQAAVIDEVQHVSALFSYIQVLVDKEPGRRFVLTGSSNFELMEKITQSLAGRAALFTLLPMALDEADGYERRTTDDILLSGLYPSVVTGARPADLFYPAYYSTYVERDLRQLLRINNLGLFQTFIRLAAGRCGTEFNASQLANEVGVSAPTVKSWMSILQTSYIAFLLPPYYANLNKRLTKTPKLYFYDTGLLCFLLGIETQEQLAVHPLRGNVFENLAVTELVKKRLNAGKLPNLCFYRENKGREADIVHREGDRLDLFEVKSSRTFSRAFVRNLDYLRDILGDAVRSTTVVYDGDPLPPTAINIRQLAALF